MNNTFHKKLYLFLVFLSIIFISYPVFSQSCDNISIDSLKQRSIYDNIELTDKIDIWNQIAKCYLDINLDSTAHYAHKAKILSKEIGFKKGVAVSTLQLARLEQTQGNYDQAIRLLDNTIHVYVGLDKDPNFLQALNSMGIIYEDRQDYDQALEYYMIGLREAELQGHKLFIAYFHNNISLIYHYTGFPEKKLIHIKKASKIFKGLGHDNYYANSLLNIGVYYLSINEYDTAVYYFLEAEKLQKSNNNYYGLTNLYLNLGDISIGKNKPEDALRFYEKALVNVLLLDSLHVDKKNRIAATHYSIGNALVELGRFSHAKEYFYASYSYGENSKSLLHQKEASYGLFSCFLYSNQPDSALFYLDSFLALIDSLHAETYNDKIDQLNYEYKLKNERELLKKDKEVIILEKKRQELIYLILVGILFIIVFAIIIIWYLQKNRLYKSELLRQNLHLEKENLSLALDRKNRELTTSVLNLIERNEFIAKVSEKLSKIKSNDEIDCSPDIQTIIRSIDKDVTNKLWKEFEMSYMEIHKDFHQKLTSKFPDLTANERKLCAFIVLNMSTKDISSVTYQSNHSIKIARYRLRKKLGLDKNKNLSTFLHSL